MGFNLLLVNKCQITILIIVNRDPRISAMHAWPIITNASTNTCTYTMRPFINKCSEQMVRI